MTRCDECKFWKIFEWPKEISHEMGHCERAMPWWEATEYVDDDKGWRRVLQAKFKDRRFFAQDGSDYHATVYTRNDFYCADWKKNR